MTTTLLIRLHANRQFDWQCIDNNHQLIAEAYQQAELQLPENSANAHIMFFVPTTDVTLLTVKLPKMKRAQLLQALPYAIEERLCEDIETLHFATGQWQKKNNEESLNIAVTSQQKIQEWLAICETAGFKPQQIIPDIFALPYSANQWTCAIENSLMLIRTEQQSGMAIDVSNVSFVLNKLIENNKPSAIVIENYDNATLTDLTPSLDLIDVKINAKPNPLLMNALHNMSGAINLMQGAYKNPRKPFQLSKEWQFTLQLAIAAVVLAIITNIASYFALNHEDAKLTAQISALTPPLRLNGDIDDSAEHRIKKQLHMLAKLGKGNQFLDTLQTLGTQLKASPNIHLEQITYQKDLFIVRINADNEQIINSWITNLRSKQFNIVRVNILQPTAADITFKGI